MVRIWSRAGSAPLWAHGVSGCSDLGVDTWFFFSGQDFSKPAPVPGGEEAFIGARNLASGIGKAPGMAEPLLKVLHSTPLQ